MAITVAGIATTVDLYLKREVGEDRPWTDSQRTQAIVDTLEQLWPDFGVLYSAEQLIDGQQLVPLPAGFGDTWRLSRILVKDTNGIVSDKASGFLPHPGNFVLIKTRVRAGAGSWVFYGFKPYLSDASNLPDRLRSAVASRAASFCWGMLAAELTNSEVQQGIDSGRVVSQAEALAAAAYFERRFQDATEREPTRISYAPRASNRGR